MPTEDTPQDTIPDEPHVQLVECYRPSDPFCPVVVVKWMSRDEIEAFYGL